ncbi:MAG: CpaF family protein [Actinomycetes bacterium]
MDPVALVEDEVRELVRQQGVDPSGEPEALRVLVESVVAGFGERVGTLPSSLGDPEAAVRTVLDSVAGFGPLQRYLDDVTVEEIWVNEPGRVFVARAGRSELTPTVLAAGQLEALVERMLAGSGRRVDLSSPFVDASLPDGSRLHVVIPDVTRRHWAVNVRKYVAPVSRLDDLVRLGSLTAQAARFLEAAVVSGLNIVVAGATQVGKTTLLNTLVNALPADRRLVTCEEVFEIRPALPDVVAMQTRPPNLEGEGEIRLRRLVKEALRMRPGCLVVGEVRQEECLDLLVALNSGVPGMCTVHANSAREAVTKLCTLPLLAGENVTTSFVVPTVAACVDLVVHAGMGGDGLRRVREVVAVSGRVEGDLVEVAPIFSSAGGELHREGGYPPHAERFRLGGFDLADLLRTTAID